MLFDTPLYKVAPPLHGLLYLRGTVEREVSVRIFFKSIVDTNRANVIFVEMILSMS